MIQPEIPTSNGATSEAAPSDAATIERVLRPLARKAGGMTGADIREVVQNARRKARREKRAVTYDDVESLLEVIQLCAAEMEMLSGDAT